MKLTVHKVYENIEAGKYTAEYPTELHEAYSNAKMELAEARKILNKMVSSAPSYKAQSKKIGDLTHIYEKSNDEFLPAKKTYNENQRKLDEQFKLDVIEACGLKDNPKAEQFYKFVYDMVNGSGYADVLHSFEDLASIILA